MVFNAQSLTSSNKVRTTGLSQTYKHTKATELKLLYSANLSYCTDSMASAYR